MRRECREPFSRHAPTSKDTAGWTGTLWVPQQQRAQQAERQGTGTSQTAG